MKALQKKIYLTVTNPGRLIPGGSSHMSFDQVGGTIGSRGTNWLLQDSSGLVNAIQCEIKWVDGAFCIVDRCGSTRLNHADEGIGVGRIAQLNAADIIGIGPFLVEVYFNELQNELPDPTKSLGQHSVNELLGNRTNRITDSAAYGENMASLTAAAYQEIPGKMEFDHMSSQDQKKVSADPLAALDQEQQQLQSQTHTATLDSTHYGRSAMNKTQPNYRETSHEAISTSDTHETREYRSTTPVNVQQQEWRAAYSQAGEEGQHLAGVPLQQGLQVNLGSMDTDAAYHMLLEAGKSLKATIEGIKKLYGDEQNGSKRLQMLTRTLQPIEDNPLRLQQNYEDTTRSMFSDYKSAVHLSAPAAIEESLEQARIHNIAVIQAISESLNALLSSFSPRVLKNRFSRYNTEYEGQGADDGWAWNMYNHYYDELTSSRQQGFEKLFWEVFEQAYDRAVRENSK